MDILIKASGDVIEKTTFYDWLFTITNSSDSLFILCGGGTSITKALQKQGIEYEFFPTGREIKNEKGRIIAEDILREQKRLTEEQLNQRGIKATVFIPVFKLGDKVCHVNGDSYAMALYPSFNKIFIVTLRGRNKSFPNDLDKIEVVYL